MIAAIIHQEQVVSLKEPIFKISSNSDGETYGTTTVTESIDYGLPHLRVRYRRNLPDGEPYDVYMFGTNHMMKLKAKWYNKHPEKLVKFLNAYGGLDDYEVTTEMLR